MGGRGRRKGERKVEAKEEAQKEVQVSPLPCQCPTFRVLSTHRSANHSCFQVY